MQTVQCFECGHSELGAMDFCPQCGAAVFSTAITASSEDDYLPLDIMESGDINFVPHFLQSVACKQLRDICQAASKNQLTLDLYGELLAELEVYLEREIVRFQLFPELENATYEDGCSLIIDGLTYMLEACAVAADLDLQGPSVLSLALQMAADADIQIGRGRQILQGLAA